MSRAVSQWERPGRGQNSRHQPPLELPLPILRACWDWCTVCGALALISFCHHLL